MGLLEKEEKSSTKLKIDGVEFSVEELCKPIVKSAPRLFDGDDLVSDTNSTEEEKLQIENNTSIDDYLLDKDDNGADMPYLATPAPLPAKISKKESSVAHLNLPGAGS